MTQLASSRSLLSTLRALAVLLLAGGASVTACGGGGGGSGDGDGDGDGSGGTSGLGGMGANAGDGDGDNDGTGGMGIIDPDASVGDIRLLECGEESEGLQAQLYTKTGWHNQTDCERPFLSRWDTAQPGVSTETQLKLPLVEEGTYDFWIDWGDETLEHITDWDAANTTHTYSEAGEYDVRVVGEWVGFRFANEDPSKATADFSYRDADKLLEVSQWGALSLGPVDSHFSGAQNFQSVAADAPDLSMTTSLTHSFSGTGKFDADIGHWDVSGVTSLSFTFSYTESFDGDIGDWDTSNVTDMSGTFQDAVAFNQDISGWDTSSVKTMLQTFSGATAFNQPIGGWDTSSLQELRGAFHGAESFNQDLIEWDVSNVTDFFRAFREATAFNGDISGWVVSSAVRMEEMFYYAESFNQDISEWDVSNVSNMRLMLGVAEAFNQPIGKWDVSKVEDMAGLVVSAAVFDQDLSSWQVPNVTDMEGIFNFSGMSTTNYSKFLSSCALQAPAIQADVKLGAVRTDPAGIYYEGGVEPNREELTNPPYNWIITDGGVAP